MLDVRGLSGSWGAAPVLHSIDMHISQGETVALLGPNGAGKSTLLAALTATLPLRSGNASMDGRDLMNMQNHHIVSHGLALVPEGRHVFSPMPVLDNLLLGSIRLPGRTQAKVTQRMEAVFELFPRLAERRHQTAGTMSGGEQQMLAIGRALMSQPRVLLLDEPFLGLAPKVIDQILEALQTLQRGGLTMLLVEQKLDIALLNSARSYVLIKGRVVCTENSAVLAARENLSQLYFDPT